MMARVKSNLLPKIVMAFISLIGFLALINSYHEYSVFISNYEINIKVNENGKSIQRIGVIEAYQENFSGLYTREEWNFRGDAIPILYPNNNIVFLTFTGENGDHSYMDRLLGYLHKRNRSNSPFVIYPTHNSNLNLMPMLIMFQIPHDPRTAKKVSPSEIREIYGSRFQIESISIIPTNNPIDRNIHLILPWVDKYRRNRVYFDVNDSHGNRYSIGASSFRM